MRIIQKCISAENGELYCTIEGRRHLLARCKPEFNVIEQSEVLPVMGSCRVRHLYLTIVLSDDIKLTRPADIELLSHISSFDMSADIWRKDGLFEKVTLDNLMPRDIDIYGTWTFELDDPEIARKLLNI